MEEAKVIFTKLEFAKPTHKKPTDQDVRLLAALACNLDEAHDWYQMGEYGTPSQAALSIAWHSGQKFTKEPFFSLEKCLKFLGQITNPLAKSWSGLMVSCWCHMGGGDQRLLELADKMSEEGFEQAF